MGGTCIYISRFLIPNFSTQLNQVIVLSNVQVILVILSMGSTVISIPDGELPLPLPNTKKEKERPNKLSIIFSNIISYLGELQKNKQNMRKLIHSFKVGIALVVVSLLYLLDPLFDRVGENAMWAIMTVVVIFEFFAGIICL